MRIWNFSPYIHETCIFPKIQAWNEIRIPALPPSYLSLGSFNFSTKNFMYWILHYYTLATTLTNNGRSTVSNSLIKNVTRSSLTFSEFIIQATRAEEQWIQLPSYKTRWAVQTMLRHLQLELSVVSNKQNIWYKILLSTPDLQKHTQHTTIRENEKMWSVIGNSLH